MSSDLDNQGRDADVPAREWNWPFICMLLGGWLFIGCIVAGAWFWGFPFVVGSALTGAGFGIFGCWALGRAAPW